MANFTKNGGVYEFLYEDEENLEFIKEEFEKNVSSGVLKSDKELQNITDVYERTSLNFCYDLLFDIMYCCYFGAPQLIIMDLINNIEAELQRDYVKLFDKHLIWHVEKHYLKIRVQRDEIRKKMVYLCKIKII